MESAPRTKVALIGKEGLRVEYGSLVCEAMCFFDPEQDSFTVVLPNVGTRLGVREVLERSDVEGLEKVVRSRLGVKKVLGIPIGTRTVHIEREQHAS